MRRAELSLPPGSDVVCAVSGGADSVALLHWLWRNREMLEITVTAAHYNHSLRGEASDGDEAFVRGLCASWGVPLTVGRGDVAAYSRQRGMSIEEAARQLRYEFLLAQPGYIAVAHNADDQVETVLLNLLRGTGLRGLCAMEPQRGRLVRPLLAVTRREIEAYLEEHSLPHREDATNGEDDALRNRLRHSVIPLLRQENPNLAGTVGRMTELLRRDEAYLTDRTEELLAQARREGGYDCPTLAGAEEVLRRRALRRLLEIPKPTMTHVEAAEALVQGTAGSAELQLPGGCVLRRQYGLLTLEREETPRSFAPVTLHPGEHADLPEAGLRVFVDFPEILEKSLDSLSTFALKCDMMKEHPALTIRPRQTGDALRRSGGQKSIKKWMIDAKLPAHRRGRIPVVALDETVLAVWSLGADCRYAGQPGDRVVCVRFQQIGEREP